MNSEAVKEIFFKKHYKYLYVLKSFCMFAI